MGGGVKHSRGCRNPKHAGWLQVPMKASRSAEALPRTLRPTEMRFP